MAYVINIGDKDNCYIIPAGITSLLDFNPIEINGSETAVSLNVDSPGDDIFKAFYRKQSMGVTVVKENELDYSDIINGSDNECYGIYIENGYLSLIDGNLIISEGGKLKFIGTLTLESYVEDYKQTSLVQFTFYDRIQSLDDEKFITNSRFKSITDVFAQILNNVILSERFSIQWPYTVGGSNNPHETKLLVETKQGDSLMDILEKVCNDFGLSLYVDFEENHSNILLECGRIKVISITEIPEQIIEFYNYTLNSYTHPICGGTFYQYDYVDKTTHTKKRTLIPSYENELINAETILALERVASSILAKTKVDRIDSSIFKGQFSWDHVVVIEGNDKYCPFYRFIGNLNTYSDKNRVSLYKSLFDSSNFDSSNSRARIYNSEIYIEQSSDVYNTYDATVCPPFRLNKSEYLSGEYKFKIKVEFKKYVAPAKVSTTIIVKKLTSETYYVNDGNTWDEFTSIKQLDNNDFTSEVDYDLTFDFDEDVLCMLVITTIGEGAYNTKSTITKINVSGSNTEGDIPDSINLETFLSGNNRKKINLETTFLNIPNLPFLHGIIDNVIATNDESTPITISYKSLNQTLLAHLSDQYGWQYDANRWNIEASVKCTKLEAYNILGQFALDDKILTLLSGQYDARRKILKGTWGQVLEIDENKYRLLDDNFIPLEWDNGSIINLN